MDREEDWNYGKIGVGQRHVSIRRSSAYPSRYISGSRFGIENGQTIAEPPWLFL